MTGNSLIGLLPKGLLAASLAFWPSDGFSATKLWDALKQASLPASSPAVSPDRWRENDVHFLESPLSPGILVRMNSPWIRFFSRLQQSGAEPPSILWYRAKSGVKVIRRGGSMSGEDMAASWILVSFQDSRGWELFDVPWFLALERKPSKVALSLEGLRIEFGGRDTGYIFSMPLYGYDKLPQRSNDLAAKHGLPSLGLEPWKWAGGLPVEVTARCDWWARVAKAYPIGFDETFRVEPAKDVITFRQDYRWLTLKDEWGTQPLRFAALSPSVGLAWKFPGFPMEFSSPIHDPGYFTAFGPLVGATDTDRLETAMKVLQYVHELEWLLVPRTLDHAQQDALNRIVEGVRAKFPEASRYQYDHGGPADFCWNLVGDVWYPRALPFVSGSLRERAKSSLRLYFANDVLRPHSPYHGKYILHGPGIGSWGEWGDAGKFMATSLQAIWAYGQFAGDWQLIRDRWNLIKRFFITPQEADWVSYGRYGIAEIGDEAAPCSAYARMAWKVGDLDEYLAAVYMFSRELIHLYVKQKGAAYFYSHQPYNQYGPMPDHIYLTNLWGSTRGWQVDGPVWGSGERQSANRWMRFHDPDTGRFYRDHLARDVTNELDWYARVGREGQPKIYAMERYREWTSRDNPHLMPSLLRLQSLLLDRRSDPRLPGQVVPARSGWGASDIAVGYSQLRTIIPREYWRLVPREIPASPFVPGLQKNNEGSTPTLVQDVRNGGIQLEPRWHGWGRPGGGFLSFGLIEGDFEGHVTGKQGAKWISYGCRLSWANSIVPRSVDGRDSVLRAQDSTRAAVIGPFSNANDNELTEASYAPEKDGNLDRSWPGAAGPVSWQRIRLATGRKVNLARQLAAPDRGGAIAYVQQYVWSPEPMDAYLLTGHHGGVAAWVNDRRILSHHGVHRPSGDDALWALVELQAGWNRILLKVESFTGEYTFQFRLVHLDRQPIPNLRFIDEKQTSETISGSGL